MSDDTWRLVEDEVDVERRAAVSAPVSLTSWTRLFTICWNADSVLPRQPRPSLNPDVCRVISQFLAGVWDFRTLARINAVNCATHDETHSVLYVFLLLDLHHPFATLSTMMKALSAPDHLRFVK